MRNRVAHNDEYYQCCILASLGFSTQYIMAQTGLSAGQIAYRLRQASLKRADYRNGESEMAKRVMKSVIPGNREIASVLDLPTKLNQGSK